MTKMYEQRKGNISVFRGCSYFCSYCAFRTSLRRSPCERCRIFEPHAHMEALEKTPPKTKVGEFITVGLTGDISFMDLADFWKVIEYCRKWKDRTFLIQSKNPNYFVEFLQAYPDSFVPENTILGTTIESNIGAWWYKEDIFDHLKKEPRMQIHYNNDISKAPLPIDRYEAMLKLNCRTAITIEPILDFNLKTMLEWMQVIVPEFIYIGYNSNPNIHLLEPSLSKTIESIERLRDLGLEVREKLMRKAWWEK